MNRLLMKINLNDLVLERFEDVKVIKDSDATELGELMYEAYYGTIDYDGESREDSIEEIKATLAGKYGKPIPSACLFIENEIISSAIIYTWYEKNNMPLLAYSMTRAPEKGKGYAQKLIKESLMRLKELTYTECCLYVTEKNEIAASIYKKLGFK